MQERDGMAWTRRAILGVAALAAVAALVPVADALVVAGPYWEVQAHPDGTFSARTGASYGTPAENLKSIVRSWTLPGGAWSYITLRTNSSCATCTPPSLAPSDYWVQGAGPLDLDIYPHPLVPDASGISWTYSINNGADQFTLSQRISQGGATATQSYVRYEVQVCNQSNLAAKVKLRLLMDMQSQFTGGPWPEADHAWIVPPSPYFLTPATPDNQVKAMPAGAVGYVYSRTAVPSNPLTYVGLTGNIPSLTWLPGPVVPPDRAMIGPPSFNSWDFTAAPAMAGDEVVAYWWGYNGYINLAAASAATGNPCFSAQLYWVPVDAVFPPPPPGPTPDFTAAVLDPQCPGQPVRFTATGNVAFTSYDWDFGDATATATGQVVTHSYYLPAVYAVTLTGYYGGLPYAVTKSVNVTVGAIPCAPDLQPFAPRWVWSGERLAVCADAQPLMGGSLVFQAGPLPTGAAFNETTGCLDWPTQPGDGGLYCIWVRATEDISGLFTDRCLVIRIRTLGAETSDEDQDGRADDVDNCPSTPNPDQADADLDGIGDACAEPVPAFPPYRSGIRRITPPDDRDADGMADASDNCPRVANLDQQDTDGDGPGDACDLDLDGDAVPNPMDNCPRHTNPRQEDTDRDGIGDQCDVDGAFIEPPREALAGRAEGPAGREFFSAAKMTRIGFGALAFAVVVLGALFVAAMARGRRRPPTVSLPPPEN